jgi:gamma-glutamyltranspeptidase/glutathione hydrolase
MTTDQGDHGATERPPTGRPVIYATQGVISSGHYLTSMAGMRLLVSGGNAFDALVAAAFAAAVVEPIAAYSLGAEGVFMLHDAASGDVLALSGQGVAPGKATVDFYKDKGLDAIPTGPGLQAPMAFTVPGVAAALIALLDRYGRKSLAEVLAPAIEYAEKGIPHYEYMLRSLDNEATKEQFDTFPPGGSEIFYDKGRLPRPGSMLVQPGLGRTLSKMAEAEGNASGDRSARLKAARDVFYSGEIAQDIVANSEAVGGIVAVEDLTGYEAKFEKPISTTFAGHEIFGQSTWTQAGVLMQTLNMLEGVDLARMGHNSPEYIHTVTETLKLAMADRQVFYGDPDFASVPIDGLLSKKYAAERADLIDAGRAYPEIPPAGDPWRHSSLKGDAPAQQAVPVALTGDGGGDDSGTTHASVIDSEGNMVCGTLSGGSFRGSVFFPNVGFTLSTRIEMFNLEEGHPNVLVPGKRPRTTLVNYIVSENGRPVMTVGCPGGDHQAQANVQLILNTLVFGMNPQQAIEAPRFGTASVVNSFYPHVYYPGRLTVEAGFSEDTLARLRMLGHEVEEVSACGLGATVSRFDRDNGVMSTGADPRRACYAIGW